MTAETSTSRHLVARAPDGRFRSDSAADEQWAAIEKIDVTCLQLDDTYDDTGDPYNNTGRHLIAALRERHRG